MKFGDIVWQSIEELKSELHIINVVLPGSNRAVLYYDFTRDQDDPCIDYDRAQHMPCSPKLIQEKLEKMWGPRYSKELLTAVMRQLALLRPIDIADFSLTGEGGIGLNPQSELFRGCLTRDESVNLFYHTHYFIDANGNSFHHISDELRRQMDRRRCSHCGHFMKDRCVNKDCVIYGHFDLFDSDKQGSDLWTIE
jgi:hypothetical protein